MSCFGSQWILLNILFTGLYYDAQEILPFVIGDHRFNKANEKLSRFASKEVEVRALVEGQSIAKRAHAEEAGFAISKRSIP